MINLVVLHVVLTRPASQLDLPSGTRIAAMEVTVRRQGAPAEPVPVSWTDPPSWVTSADTGTEVVVLGRVRRRFFRSGGATQSRTEVVAARVVRASSRAKVAALMAEAVHCLESRDATVRPGGVERL